MITKPATLTDLSTIESRAVYHNACGGAVAPDFYNEIFRCRGCRAKWVPEIMRKFTAADLADRFHVRVPPSVWPEVLVWVVDGKIQFSQLVKNPPESAERVL